MGHERRGKYRGPYLYPSPSPSPSSPASVGRLVRPHVRVPPRSRIPDDERQIRGLPPAPTTSAADTPSPGTQSAKETYAVCVHQAASRGVASSACLVVVCRASCFVRRASASHSLRAVASVYRQSGMDSSCTAPTVWDPGRPKLVGTLNWSLGAVVSTYAHVSRVASGCVMNMLRAIRVIHDRSYYATCKLCTAKQRGGGLCPGVELETPLRGCPRPAATSSA